MSAATQKIILFGGSFDPIHNGHLAVAAYALDRLSADRLYFIPARRSPHKTCGPSADSDARAAMIRLAITGCDGFELSTCELKRAEPSYTLDTVQDFCTRFGTAAELFWLVGADAIRDLDRWYRIEELLALCRVCIMYRGGMPRPDLTRLVPALGAARVARLEADILPTPLVEVSSTEIRARLAAGESTTGMLPESVWEYIRQNSLYGAMSSG